MGCPCEREFRKVRELTILPTYSCNFNCKYCYLQDWGFTKPLRMSKSVIDRTLEFFVPERVENNFSLWFFGGEPLLEKNLIIYAVERLKEITEGYNLQFRTGATTNGFFLDEDFTEWCLQNNFMLLISYDGYENQRIFRGRKGHRLEDAEVVEENIRLFHSTDKGRKLAPTAAIQLPPGGVENLYENAMSAYELGFRNIALNKMTAMASKYAEMDFVALKREITKLSNYIKEQNGKTISFFPKFEQFLCSFSFLSKQQFVHSKSCGAAKGQLSIAPNGEIFPCHRLHQPEFSLGSVLEGKIWLAKRERIAEHAFSSCVFCEVRCTPCYSSAFDVSKDIEALPENECKYEKMFFKIFMDSFSNRGSGRFCL